MKLRAVLEIVLYTIAIVPLLLLGILGMVGCDSPAVAKHEDQKALAAAIFATAIDEKSPAPAPVPQPGGKCDNCNGKGKLGDGTVSVICPVCEGDGIKGSGFSIQLPPMTETVPSVADLLEVAPVNSSETPNSSDHIPDVSTMVVTAPPQQVVEVANTSRPVGGCSCGPDCDCDKPCTRYHCMSEVPREGGRWILEWNWHPDQKPVQTQAQPIDRAPPVYFPSPFDQQFPQFQQCGPEGCPVPMQSSGRRRRR